MLRTRIWVGTLLVLAISGILIGDGYFQPHSPFLLAAVLFLGWFGTLELWRMLPETDRPAAEIVGIFVPLLLASNWFFLIANDRSPSGWQPVGTVLVFAILVSFLYEILNYSNDGHSTRRVAFSLLFLVYLGLLPCFLVQLRWLDPGVSTFAIAAVIFVPKVGDIFALFTGMAIGKHKFTPTLSPKKTWEGFVGGLIAATTTAAIFHFSVPGLFARGLGHAIVFGLFVGLAGVFGDLAESMMKRDCLMKDASKSIPGFGGVLDVVDSVLFAAPVAYLLFQL